MLKPSERHFTRTRGKPKVAHSRKDQYDLLLRYYTEEGERYEALNKRAAAYLSIVGAVSAFAAFKTDVSFFSSRSLLITALAVAALCALLFCVLAVALSVRISEYKSPVRPKELVLAAEKDQYTAEDTYSVILAGLVDSIEWNRRQNDRRAISLQVSLWFAAAAVVLAIAINVVVLFQPPKEMPMSSSNQNTGSSAPAPVPPSQTPMSELLNRPQTAPLKKSDDTATTPLSQPKK